MKTVMRKHVLLRIRKLFLQLLQLTTHGAVVNGAAHAHDHAAQELCILVISRPHFLSGGESYLRLQALLLIRRKLAGTRYFGFHKSKLAVQFSLKLARDLRQHGDASVVDEHRKEISDGPHGTRLPGNRIEHRALLVCPNRGRFPNHAQIFALGDGPNHVVHLLHRSRRIDLFSENHFDQGAGVTAGNRGHTYSPSFPRWRPNWRTSTWSVSSSTLILCEAISTASDAAKLFNSWRALRAMAAIPASAGSTTRSE